MLGHKLSFCGLALALSRRERGRLLSHRWMRRTRQRCRASRRGWGSAAPAQSARGRAGAHNVQHTLAKPQNNSVTCLHMPSAGSAMR